MSATKRPEPYSRFHPSKITDEITAQRCRLGWEIKDLAWETGMGEDIARAQDNWYKAQRRNSWSILQLGRIAEALGAPDYWPFREWTVEMQQTVHGRRKGPPLPLPDARRPRKRRSKPGS